MSSAVWFSLTVCDVKSWNSSPQCLCLLLSSVAIAVGSAHKRSKRGLLELAGAIKCSTGRFALAYMMYGCYCGLGGQGWPRDKADW